MAERSELYKKGEGDCAGRCTAMPRVDRANRRTSYRATRSCKKIHRRRDREDRVRPALWDAAGPRHQDPAR